MTLPKDRVFKLAEQSGASIDDDAGYDDSSDGTVYCLTPKMLLEFAALIQSQPAEAQGGQEPAWIVNDAAIVLQADTGDFAEQHVFKRGDNLYRQPTAPEPISWSEEKCGRCEKTVMFRLNVSAAPSLPGSGE